MPADTAFGATANGHLFPEWPLVLTAIVCRTAGSCREACL